MEGMASFIAKDEDNFDRTIIRDAVVNNIIPPVENLNQLSVLTYRYGRAIFDFMDQEWGPSGLRNFVWEYRKNLLTNNIGKTIREAFGIELDEFNRRFNRYLRKKYFPVLMEKLEPGDTGKEIGLRKPWQFTFSPALSPSGELIAALATPHDELDVVILSTNSTDGKPVRNLTRGYTNKYQEITAAAFKGARDLTWSPEGDDVAFFVRKENRRQLMIYNAVTGKHLDTIDVDADIATSPAFSPDGKSILYSGNKNGITDIHRLDLATQTEVNLTDDNYFDTNPVWSQDGKTVLYNRRIGGYQKIFLLDAADPTRKTQLTYGPSADLMPMFSRDGQTVYFVSDRGPLGIFNVWSLDTTTGELNRWTDLVGGAISPVQVGSGEGTPQLAYVAWFRGTFRLYKMDLKTPVETIAGEAPEAAEIEPFLPPLQLRSDESEKHPYKVRWSLDVPQILIGVADDGTVFSNTDVSFTDLLGDHRLRFRLASVSSFTNTDLIYMNLKHRLQWGAHVQDYRDYYVAGGNGVSERLRRAYRLTGAEGVAQYPFNRYYRVEGNLGAFSRSLDIPFIDNASGRVKFANVSDKYGLAGLSLSGDTTRFQYFGPSHGLRFSVGATRGQQLSGDTGSFTNYDVDYRGYVKVTSRSLLAMRVAGLVSTGEGADIYSVGGYNQLRGYEFREFAGNEVAWTNLEFRFPLIDDLRFPFGSFGQLRGLIFIDAAASQFEDGLFYDPHSGTIRFDPNTYVAPDPFTGKGGNIDFIRFRAWDSENNRFQDLRATWGVGFHFLFSGLQVHFEFAHQLPYTEFDQTNVLDANGNPVIDPMTGKRVKQFGKTEVNDGTVRGNFWIGWEF
jgi:WD40 repeat protein